MSLEEAIAAREGRVAKLRDLFSETLKGEITFEVGCGKGHYLSSYAAAHPGEVCVGADIISERVRDARRRASNKGASNAYFFKAEAGEFLDALPKEVLLKKIFIFFPDPWPKKKHRKRRLIGEKFLEDLSNHSTRDAVVFFRTDFREYFDFALDCFANSPHWEAEEIENLPFEEVSQFQRILPNFSTLMARRISGRRSV